jgi:diacylglycerol kinase family enzyme
MRAELIYNPHAGRRVVRRELGLVTEYLERQGWTTSVHETRAPRDATQLARQAASSGVDVVIAAGGDGTVNEVASGLIYTDTALGVLPIGTTNVWALQMRIPALSPLGPGPGLAKLVADLEDQIDYPLPISLYRSVLLNAARVLVEGAVHTVDMGQAGDRYFLMWAGVGLDAAVTANISPEDKKIFGPWAFVGTGLDMLRDYKSTNVSLTLDGKASDIKASLIVASNIRLYGGLVAMGARAHVDDGKLDVCIFKGEGIFNYVQYLFKLASGLHLQDPQVEYYQSREIAIESSKPMPVHVDDEPFAETPVTMHIVPGAIKAILPKNAPRDLFVAA